jgi:protein gp37
MGVEAYRNSFSVTLHPSVLSVPFSWKKPRLVFVNSMSDLFHEEVPDGFILDVFEVMNSLPRHTFQVLTKRPDRLLELDRILNWKTNVWMGVTVESSDQICRLDCLRWTGAEVKFVSFEPLLGPVCGADLSGIDWAIVGGESGPGARLIKPEWARSLRDTCSERGIPFFFKQWGGPRRKAAGRLLDGRLWDEMPR